MNNRVMKLILLSLGLTANAAYPGEDCNVGGYVRGSQKKYCLRFLENPEIGPGGRILLVGKGQYSAIEKNDTVILTSVEVVRISSSSIQVKLDEKLKDFQITEATKLCVGGKRIAWQEFKPGDGVTIKSGLEEKQAITVRKGLMRFQAGMNGTEPQEYGCK